MVIQLVFWRDKTTTGMTEVWKISVKTLTRFLFYPMSSQEQAVISFPSVFILLWVPWHDQNGLYPPRKSWKTDLILEGSGSKANLPPLSGRVSFTKRTSTTQEKDQVIPGNTFRSSFLSSYSFKINSSQSVPKTMFNGIYQMCLSTHQ